MSKKGTSVTTKVKNDHVTVPTVAPVTTKSATKGKAVAAAPIEVVEVEETVEETVDESAEETKKEKIVIPGPGPNNDTNRAGLTFCVNRSKGYITKHLKKEEKEIPKYGGAQYALSALNESLCENIVKQSIKKCAKNKSGLHEITRPLMRDVVLLTEDLCSFFKSSLERFDPGMPVEDGYFVKQETLKRFIEKSTTVNVLLGSKVLALLTYLLIKASNTVIDTAYRFMTYAKKKTLDDKSIIYAVETHFSASLAHSLKMRIEEVMRSGGADAVNEEEGEADEQVAETTEQVETTTTTKGGKKAPKKPVVTVEEEVTDEQEDDADEPVEEVEEVEEEVIVVAPVSTKKGTKATSKK